jgi:CO/xanthine dehydrogenase Mo-binding subunit
LGEHDTRAAINDVNIAFLLAPALKVPSNKLRLQPVPARGGFGFPHNVPAPAGFLAPWTRRPVRCVEDSGDHLATSDHDRCGRHHDVALAVDRDGVLADFGDARVTELPIRPWWIVEMIENGR